MHSGLKFISKLHIYQYCINILGILVTRRGKNKENESPEVKLVSKLYPEGIKKSYAAHYSDTGTKIKINNENQTRIASVHDGKKQPFQCNTCDAYFSKKSKLASHIFDAVCFGVDERNKQDLPKNSSSTTRYTDSGIKIKIKKTPEQTTNKQIKNENYQTCGEIPSSTTRYTDSGIKIKMKLFGI